MTYRADHIAGAGFILFGVLVFVIGHDLPFGTLTEPGAGMLPKLMAGAMIVFAAIIMLQASAGPKFSEIDWSDRGHAALLVLITAIATLSYRPIGFLITFAVLVFALLVVVERRRLLPAALYSIALTLFAYWLFGKALKSPLERGLLWF
jgi:hypothetical protein